MPTDEVLIRDSCAKSRSNIKKYFYYNEYSKDNFPFKSNFEELTLLDMMEGTKSIVDVLPMFVPYILIIILAIICIGVWISVCCCSIKPRCCLKKDNKNTNRTRFICFMIFSGFSLSIIVLGIVLLVYIYYAEGDFNGSICSLLMLQYEIINGQGFLSKNKLSKPFWYGSNEIGNSIQNINTLLEELKTVCTDEDNFEEELEDSLEAAGTLESRLQLIYNNNKDENIEGDSPSGLRTYTVPIYISNLGPKENNETFTGRVYDGYKRNFEYIKKDVLEPVYGICKIMSQDGGESLSSGLSGFESVISSLNSTLENLSSTITTYITQYSNYIVNFGYKVNFSLFAIITGSMVIECILFISYYFRPFTTIKCNIYIFINLMNLTLILCIIFNGVFGILSLLTGNLADIVDAALSNENFAAEKPRLVGEGDEIKKLARCLRGDGDLFDEFVTDEVKLIVEPLTRLYSLYTPVKTIDEKINNEEEKTEYNSLIELDKVIEELEKMKADFILTTTIESSGNNDINTMLDELTKYTMAGRRYQIQCAQASYDIWTTSSEHCPSVQADNNIITGECKILNDYYDSAHPEQKAQEASEIYNQACPLITTDTFPDVKTAVYKYILSLSNYRIENERLINTLLGSHTNENINDNADIDGFIALNNYFKNKFITPIKPAISTINEKVTGKVYTVFNELLNDTTQDTSKLNLNNFNLFSWMNCSAIGQDYNATLSTLKSNLTNEMRVITICSLICEFLLIANLYIMVGLAKNLRDKVFEINDARDVSHSSDNIEEIEINSIKPKKPEKEDDEIYAIKNKKKFDVEQNVDTKRGINVDEDLNTDGNGIAHPAIVSINGPDGRCLFENGENAHNKMNSNKNNNINKEDKETEDGNDTKKDDNKLKVKESVEKKNLPSKKKDIISSDEEESDEESSKQTKNTKSKANKSMNKLKSSKSIKKEEKKSEVSSSSVSFG